MPCFLSGDESEATIRWVRKAEHLAQIAERVCSKMEHPTASVTILDQEDLRAALDGLKSA